MIYNHNSADFFYIIYIFFIFFTYFLRFLLASSPKYLLAIRTIKSIAIKSTVNAIKYERIYIENYKFKIKKLPNLFDFK